MKWGALLSQTGRELATICNDLNIIPSVILSTNPYENLCDDLKIIASQTDFIYIPLEDSKSPYVLLKYLSDCTLVTLHGWLRIIPEIVCNTLNIYNGHPGDVVQYPELKGFNPQQKAYDLKLPISGSIIHKVTSEVDDGPIKYRVITSIKNCDLGTIYDRLRYTSLLSWKLFFTRQFTRPYNLRYAISGSHCTGKTTLVKALQDKDIFGKYMYITSMTREAQQLGYKINEQGNDETQLYILNKHLERLVATKPCVLDRSIIDGYTYTKILYESGNISDTVMKYAKGLLNVEFMNRYTKIFYLPPTLQMVNDGLRSTEPEFRKHIISVFDNIIQCASLFIPDLVTTIDGTVEERVRSVNNYLKI
jgi:predicted ATPase